MPPTALWWKNPWNLIYNHFTYAVCLPIFNDGLGAKSSKESRSSDSSPLLCHPGIKFPLSFKTISEIQCLPN